MRATPHKAAVHAGAVGKQQPPQQQPPQQRDVAPPQRTAAAAPRIVLPIASLLARPAPHPRLVLRIPRLTLCSTAPSDRVPKEICAAAAAPPPPPPHQRARHNNNAAPVTDDQERMLKVVAQTLVEMKIPGDVVSKVLMAFKHACDIELDRAHVVPMLCWIIPGLLRNIEENVGMDFVIFNLLTETWKLLMATDPATWFDFWMRDAKRYPNYSSAFAIFYEYDRAMEVTMSSPGMLAMCSALPGAALRSTFVSMVLRDILFLTHLQDYKDNLSTLTLFDACVDAAILTTRATGNPCPDVASKRAKFVVHRKWLLDMQAAGVVGAQVLFTPWQAVGIWHFVAAAYKWMFAPGRGMEWGQAICTTILKQVQSDLALSSELVLTLPGSMVVARPALGSL
jgi:hypothetical protein